MKITNILKIAAVALVASLGCVFGPVLAQSTGIAGDVSGILGQYPYFPNGARFQAIDQTVAGSYAKRVALAVGVGTFTFPTNSYLNTPICTATEEGVTGQTVKITAISTSAVTFTSNVTAANTDNIDIVCVGNPN